MDRVKPGGYSAVIEAAYELIPGRLHPLLRTDFLCGTDPVFAGLHRYEEMSYGRSYRDVGHTVYPFHVIGPADRRRMTIVLPEIYPRRVLIHELGHVLHHNLRFEPQAQPVTDYAGHGDWEAFAEAFTAWVLPLGHGYGAAKDRLYADDPQTVALFEELSYG